MIDKLSSLIVGYFILAGLALPFFSLRISQTWRHEEEVAQLEQWTHEAVKEADFWELRHDRTQAELNAAREACGAGASWHSARVDNKLCGRRPTWLHWRGADIQMSCDAVVLEPEEDKIP